MQPLETTIGLGLASLAVLVLLAVFAVLLIRFWLAYRNLGQTCGLEEEDFGEEDDDAEADTRQAKHVSNGKRRGRAARRSAGAHSDCSSSSGVGCERGSEHTKSFMRAPFSNLSGCNAFKYTKASTGDSVEIEGEIDDEIGPDDSVSMAWLRGQREMHLPKSTTALPHEPRGTPRLERALEQAEHQLPRQAAEPAPSADPSPHPNYPNDEESMELDIGDVDDEIHPDDSVSMAWLRGQREVQLQTTSKPVSSHASHGAARMEPTREQRLPRQTPRLTPPPAAPAAEAERGPQRAASVALEPSGKDEITMVALSQQRPRRR